ncbi:MAG TPA: SDR family oxidoreductase [Methylomirabilota bacterium]|nr:SDR family oxidoreductase [Methylomirabilota bacterium]
MSDKYTDNNNDRRRRVTVITGSGKGIGKSIALEFAKAGYCVMINDLEQEELLKSTAEEISKIIGDNTRVGYVIGDVSQEEISVALVEQTIKKFQRIDVLINNAAIAEKVATKKPDQISTTATNSHYKQASRYFTLEEYEVADANLKGAYFCIRQTVKRMAELETKDENKKEKRFRRRKTYPYSIINISAPYESIPKVEADEYTLSMSGVDPYTSSRAGVKTLTKTVAFQLSDKGIRVNAIAPGLVATDIINEQFLEDEAKREEKVRGIPFHRIGQLEEIAKIALFLASDDASYITGSMIYADGGLSLSRSNYFLESKIEHD